MSLASQVDFNLYARCTPGGSSVVRAGGFNHEGKSIRSRGADAGIVGSDSRGSHESGGVGLPVSLL